MHALSIWLLAASATTIPVIGWVVAIPLVATGDKLATVTLVLANILDHARAHMRRRVSRKLWATDIPRRMAWLDRWGTPVFLAFHAIIIWSTLLGRSITWAGHTYVVDRQQRVSNTTDRQPGPKRSQM